MTFLLKIFVLIPALGFIISLLVPNHKEGLISWTAFTTIGLHLNGFFVFLVYWLMQGHPDLNLKDIVLFEAKGYTFFIDFYFDKITAVYLFVGSLLCFLVTMYSRYYLHREAGYKRFYNTVLFFYFGYTLVIFSGNLETLFLGWEILGISSFLLIAFYRNRYLPVKNAVKVFSIYRLADVGLLLAMWMSHHLWHENITFIKLNNYELVHGQLQSHSLTGVFISVMILLAAAIKSAQFPFSSWLPRAMEGPTPSSAIFYGSLSVHIGVFLLLRTFPFWEHQLSIRILFGVLGLVTSIVATFIARTQSNIKSQIAYASISQIGLIFIEVAAGFENLALIHFMGNAFLRTYQLLVSPSVVTYLIREQFYNFVPREQTIEDSFPKKLEYSLYILSIREWNLDRIMNTYLWSPLKRLGNGFRFITSRHILPVVLPVYVIGVVALLQSPSSSGFARNVLPIVFAIFGLVMVLRAFTERKSAPMSWWLIILNHFSIALSISFNEYVSVAQTVLYLSGVVVSGLLGIVIFSILSKREPTLSLEQFNGLSLQYPKLAFLFLLACLGLAGFPITPTFIGEDVILSHIHEDQLMLVFITALSFIIDGLSLIRIFARVFMGPNQTAQEKMAYRSA